MLDSSTSTLERTPTVSPSNDIFDASNTESEDNNNNSNEYNVKLQEAEKMIEQLQIENYRQKQEVRKCFVKIGYS